MIALHRPGDEVTITQLRGDEQQTAKVKLPAGGGAQAQVSVEASTPDALAGVCLAPLDRAHPAWGEIEGVVVTEVAPNSRAAVAGIEDGDVISAVNLQPVTSIRELGAALDQAFEKAPDAVALSVWRDGRLVLLVLGS